MDQTHIQNCLTEIEKRLNWGPGNQWTNQDFELLVEEIFNKTGVNLSLTTLKRIWGKVDYQSSPSTSTLNVLAQYLGYAHWREYLSKHTVSKGKKKPSKSIGISRQIKSYFNQKVIVVIVVIVATSSLFFLLDRRQVFYKSEEVVFKSKKVTKGLPNTVVFDYDVSKVIADSFHIQQSWDPRRRIRVSQNETQHTSFYYYPGFFHAKLIANDEVIKEREVLVESNGWIGMIERFPEPIYIDQLLTENGCLIADLSNYLEKQNHYRDGDFWIDYYYVEDFGQVNANNFSYSCRIRNNSQLGGVCRESRVSIICTKGRYNIPLCDVGCVSNIDLTLGNLYLQGKKHDLSGLGCDLNEWTDFRLSVDNKKCEIFINDKLRISKSYTTDLGKVVGVKFKFNGNGEIDLVQIKNHEDSILFEETFEKDI